MIRYGKFLAQYLKNFKSDWLGRDQYREWSFLGTKLRLAPGVFPCDSPYSLTTTSMLRTLEKEEAQVKSVLGAGCLAADIGCGNGAYAIHLARMAPKATILAIDTDCRALASASWNAERTSNVRVLGSDLFTALRGGSLSLVVSSLPFAEDLANGDLLSRFWSTVGDQLASEALIFFCWTEWAGYDRLEAVCKTSGFRAVRYYEYDNGGKQLRYSWRVYIYEVGLS